MGQTESQHVMPESFTRFGELLRYLRLRARLTQRELSITVGYNFAQISRLESGQRLPDPAVISAVFVPALDLANEPAWAVRLIALAKDAVRQVLDQSVTTARATSAEEHEEQPPPAERPGTLPLLATKLYLPQERADVVPRPRLLQRLDAALTVPLTLVSAGAGFGKTTLLASWLAEAQSAKRKTQSEPHEASTDEGSDEPLYALRSNAQMLQSAWLSLDASDNDLALFLRYLVAALRRLLPSAGTTTLALLDHPQLPASTLLLTPLLNDLVALPSPSLLVLDDYHLLTDPHIHEAVLFLVEHLPPQLHLVLASRTDPPLPLARLRARHRLVELRAADLRFSSAEAYAFVNKTLGVGVTPEQAALLEARTEGWAAGLQLAGLALRGRQDQAGFFEAFSGSHRFVADYLASEVLERMPAHQRAFVLQTSILDRLCGSLCDAVLGVSSGATEPDGNERSDTGAPADAAYSQLLLAELERAQLFLVPLDDERRWYRYHHLFAEMLQARLRAGTSVDDVHLLYRRAAAWYEREGASARAIDYALAGQDWERAAALIGEEALPLVVHGQIQTVLAWLQQLPTRAIQARPLLGHASGLALMLTGQFDAALAQIDRAEAASPTEPADELARLARGRLSELRGHIALMRGDAEQASVLYANLLNRFPTAAALPRVQQMIDLSRANVAVYQVAMDYQATGEVGADLEHRAEAAIVMAQGAGNRAAVLNGYTYLASVQRLGGRLRTALATYRRYEALVPHREAVQAGGMPAYQVGMGELHVEWNELADAEPHLTHVIETMQGALVADAEVCLRGHVALARFHQARADGAAALATVDAFRRLVRTRKLFPLLGEQIAAVEAHLFLRQGRLADAAAWAARVEPLPAEPPSYPREVISLNVARVQVATGRAEQAQPLLAQLLAAAEARGRIQSMIEVLLVQSLAAAALGDFATAHPALGRALALAEPEGYLRVFLDEGSPLAHLLAHALDETTPHLRRYVARLLAAFDPA